MEDKRGESVEELAEELESRFARAEEGADDELEEIDLDDSSEEWAEEKFLEEEFPEEDWEDEETVPMKPWMVVLVTVGLVVLAAIICAVLWHFTHLEDRGGDRNSQSPSAASGAGPDAGADGASGAGPGAGAGGASGAASGAGTDGVFGTVPTATPEAPATPAPTPTPSPVAPTPAATPTATPSSPAVQEPVSGTTAMEFTQDIADVTPKDVINLRSEPSTLNADNITAQAKNGEVLNRTGINEATGWTRIEYNGETLYAVSQYLTTDLTYRTPVQTANPNRVNTLDGRIIIFVDCSDNITPKEYVNLRTEPSTSEGETTVRCQVSNGEVLHRTGYSPDAGWSRVEYNGESLYVVSSYVYTVE